MHAECMNCQNVHDECMNGLNPCMTCSNDQSNKHTSNMNMNDDQTTYQTIHFKHNNSITWAKAILAKKFKQDVTNCQDHKQDWSSLLISTLLVLKPAVLHPTL